MSNTYGGDVAGEVAIDSGAYYCSDRQRQSHLESQVQVEGMKLSTLYPALDTPNNHNHNTQQPQPLLPTTTMYSFSFASATGVEVDTTSLPPLILEQMAAGAFRSLCQHLAARSDQVAVREDFLVIVWCM